MVEAGVCKEGVTPGRQKNWMVGDAPDYQAEDPDLQAAVCTFLLLHRTSASSHSPTAGVNLHKVHVDLEGFHALDSFKGLTTLHAQLSGRENTMILFPCPSAVDIETIQLDEGDSRPRNLIVVDGTWRQAGRVMRNMECLRLAIEEGRVTCVQFANAGSSSYTFRKEPREYCLSTLESICYALRFLEPTEAGSRAEKHMITAFNLMVKLQVDAPAPLPSRSSPCSASPRVHAGQMIAIADVGDM